MSVEVTAILRFENAFDAAMAREDIENEFDCYVIEWEEEEV